MSSAMGIHYALQLYFVYHEKHAFVNNTRISGNTKCVYKKDSIIQTFSQSYFLYEKSRQVPWYNCISLILDWDFDGE